MTHTFDLRVRSLTRSDLASFARAATGRPLLSIQPIDVPGAGAPASYRVVVRHDEDSPDAATLVATLAWMLSAAGHLISVRPAS